MNKKLSEYINIKKDDPTSTKIAKWAVWFSIVLCAFWFCCVWIIFFILLGIPAIFYKLCKIWKHHHQFKEASKIAHSKDYDL